MPVHFVFHNTHMKQPAPGLWSSMTVSQDQL